MFFLLFSSLINALIFFRIIEIGYFPKFDENEQESHNEAIVVAEVPATMMIPMILTAISLIVIGIYTNEIISSLVRWTIPAGL